ncbi:glycosyltransferase family 4 protein [Oscillatoria sp. FACHB-1406]|uniref:glycosyltransferase family 4 protein n=1 Tax=Oscillatoria sp. FACHB-1406 TaxID=2692846 RepID=UPI0016839906|nr:glycosyltransferase family 4 protein [Oscillatoria sp. FACHB-1406]MBD2580518.1 glycosyltransferase family 4 protein [Oscillatoria sp. FACHB-1406]
MRIAQIAPLWERVPPPGYGGIELVVSHLTDELVRRGHEVTLFASGDSKTLAKLESVVPEALRLNPEIKEPFIYEMLQLAQIVDKASEFDIVHFHTGLTALPFEKVIDTNVLHTLHGRFTTDNVKLFDRYKYQPFSSISNSQREGGPELNYVGTVYNGIDADAYPFCEKPQDPPYLAFLGRMSPEKGPHLAVEIAKRTGWNLRMAGKIDVVDKKFYEQEIEPLLDGEQIQYLGELSHEEKAALLGGASATLFTITWPEPFGLVMIESMAAGTPVIGMKMGSVPEVIAHGKSGYICTSVEEAIEAVPKAIALNRRDCRQHVEDRFTVAKMTDAYEVAFQKIMEGK